jgi:rod shape determining protein RodA
MSVEHHFHPESRDSRQNRLHSLLNIDLPLLVGLLMLCGYGLFILYSASGGDMEQVNRQAMRLLLAFGVMIAVAQISPMRLQRWAIWPYLLGVLLLVAVLVIGEIGKGAQRWLDLGVVRFQPSEIMKLALPIAMAWFLARGQLPPRLKDLILAGFLMIIPVLMIAKQPDLGTSLLVASAGFFVLFLGGLSWRLLFSLTALAAAAAPVLWMFMHNYQRQRVLTFLNPQSDPLGTGYHIIQSKIAIGSGGFYGKGWLQGTQSHLEFLPERHTDFIFAVLAEELGLMGVILLVVLYLFIIYRGLYIAATAQTSFNRLLAGSLVLVFFVYVFVNIGMVSGLLPVVGVPLPLVSYGGTSGDHHGWLRYPHVY